MCAAANPALVNAVLRTATAADARDIRDLLERSALPTSDLAAARPEFVIASRAGQIIGIGALERFGSVALLRSVAVEPRWQGSGLGRLIVNELEQRARAAGIGELILLTLTARAFFEHLGYCVKPREQVPVSVLESAEFRSLCPASAICMTRELR
jgi:amino-acid N-acetyltransferase